MAAGLGFKDFTTGEILLAADVDGYLMQGVWVFADAAARDAAVTSPEEGNACYLKDTNEVLTYSGSVWVAVGGGSPLTTKGDLFTFSTVDARLGVGANGTTLVADSSEATGLKWAAPTGGGMTLLSTTTLSTTSTLITLSGGYKQYYITGFGFTFSTNSSIGFQCNATANIIDFVNAVWVGSGYTGGAIDSDYDFIGSSGDLSTNSNSTNGFALTIFNPDSTTANKNFQAVSGYYDNSNRRGVNFGGGLIKTTSALSSITFTSSAGTFSAGTVLTYGVN